MNHVPSRCTQSVCSFDVVANGLRWWVNHLKVLEYRPTRFSRVQTGVALLIISHGWKSARLASMHHITRSVLLNLVNFPRARSLDRVLRAFRVTASARTALSYVQCIVRCDTQSLATQCCASPQKIGYHMHELLCQMRERRSARTPPDVALRDTNWRAPHAHILSMWA